MTAARMNAERTSETIAATSSDGLRTASTQSSRFVLGSSVSSVATRVSPLRDVLVTVSFVARTRKMSRGLSRARAGVVGVRVDRGRRVGEDHARPRAAVERERQLEDLAVELPAALAQRVVELRARRDAPRCAGSARPGAPGGPAAGRGGPGPPRRASPPPSRRGPAAASGAARSRAGRGAARRRQPPRTRYPAPRTVRMSAGCSGRSSSFSLRWRMWTSMARGSR